MDWKTVNWKNINWKNILFYAFLAGTAASLSVFFYHDYSVRSSLSKKYHDSEAAIQLLKSIRLTHLYQTAHKKDPLISPAALSLALDDIKKAGKKDTDFDLLYSLARIRALLGAPYPTDFALALSEINDRLFKEKPEAKEKEAEQNDLSVFQKNFEKESVNEIMTLALEAYLPPNKVGNGKYRVIDYQPSLNGFSATAFQDDDDNIVIAFRGADEMKDMDDVKRILNGEMPMQFGNAMHFYRRLRNNYPDAPIRATGHSLGGSLAQVLAVYHDDVSALTCNPVGTKRLIQKDFNADNIFNLIVRNDVFPLAMPQAGHSVVIPPENTDKYGDPLHPHSVLQCFFK